MGPMGVTISKSYSSYSYCSFSTKRFLNVPLDSPHKCYRNLEIKKKRLKFSTVANVKIENCQFLGNGQTYNKTG